MLGLYSHNPDNANAAGAAGTQADRFCGTLGAFVVTSISPDGCVSFRFTSDGSFQYAGWTATISCVTPCVPPTAALVNSSNVSICSSNSLNPGSTTVAFDASNSTTLQIQSVLENVNMNAAFSRNPKKLTKATTLKAGPTLN